GVNGALAELKTSLVALERLAPALAAQCLDIIFGDAKHRAGEVRKIIGEQLSKIEKSAVLGIEVSRADFSNREAVAALARRIGMPAAVVSARAEIPDGGCIMRLRLGQMEIGLSQQWDSLRDLL